MKKSMFTHLQFNRLSIKKSHIGIGTPLAGRPSHTTQHTDPYCAEAMGSGLVSCKNELKPIKLVYGKSDKDRI